MTQAPGVEQAFASLEAAPPLLQGLLRPVLVRALQDPVLMRQVGSASLSQHLALLGRILESSMRGGSGSAVVPPPKSFLHLTIGEDVDDIDQAYRLVRSLEPSLRAHVESGLSCAFQITADRSEYGGLSLLALARLLALALSNLPFVEHVLAGGAIEPFLPPVSAQPPAAKSTAKGTQPGGSTAKSREEREPSPELSHVAGELVEIVAAVSEEESGEAGRVFVTVGRVLEMSPGHVLLETLRDDGRPGSRLLLSVGQVVAMRTLSGDSLFRAFEAGKPNRGC